MCIGDEIAEAMHGLIDEFPSARVEWKTDFSHPHVHLEIDALNGMIFEMQVGAWATFQFLETRDVVLPSEFMVAMGRSDDGMVASGRGGGLDMDAYNLLRAAADGIASENLAAIRTAYDVDGGA